MTLHTTFTLLRERGACPEGYRTLAKHLGGVRRHGANTPIPLLTILESNGLRDALWCLRATLPGEAAERDRIGSAFACDCAEHVLWVWERYSPNDRAPHRAIEVRRRYADGKATREELNTAIEEVAGTAGTAAWAAAGAAEAAWATGAEAAATGAAWAAGEAAERAWQTERLRYYLGGKQP